ncbi:carbonyl reductase [Setomelanomma holmii]|uniref:Carbonyl reductase n=1 Tax=Setomelanomma holmii TaxID=210430 RepID=A0A9P4H3X0_9PLEO|nr:carbonyl reductase [Setomelanomma holmii]
MESTTKQIALIIGANRGTGLELARTLAHDHDFHVVLGSRSSELGSAAAAELHQSGLSASFVALDICADTSITAAAQYVGKTHGHIDVLINNAGVHREAFQHSFNTNVTGAALVTDAFVPLLYKAPLPRILFIGSRLGSISTRLDSNYVWDWVDFLPYRSSKTALNMLAAHYANRFKDEGWKVNVVCPGYVKTRTGGSNGDITTEEAMPGLVRLCTLGEDGETGTFSDVDETLPL